MIMTKYKYSLCIKNKNDHVQPQNIAVSNCLLRSKSGSESWPKMIQKLIKGSSLIIKMAQNEFTLGRKIKYHSSTITFLQTHCLWKLQSKPNTHKMVLDWTQKKSKIKNQHNTTQHQPNPTQPIYCLKLTSTI